ncbi:MAG: hypothetical protein K2L57_03720 [Muribaculaceae bacterium]|nr:hypothetical protein [Muribaculaceae bacterium]
MIHRHVMGREGMLLATLVALAMFAVAFFIDTPNTLAGNMGICLPSPNMWGLSPLWGWITNLIFMTVLTVTLFLVNKEFSFVQGSDTVLTGMFIIMASSNTWISGTLSSTLLLALANLICLLELFGCYRKRNSAQELFVIATILSLGSMIQYAFIFMMPAYLIGAMLLKCFNFKRLVAFLMGIVAPYWVGGGLGIIPPDCFTMPTFTNLFDGYATKSGLFIGLVNVALTVLTGFLLSLNNTVRLYAGNTQRRLCNTTINVLGLVCAACMVIDFNNMVVYMATVYMITAIQLANLFALWNIQHGSRWLFGLSLIYVLGFLLMVFY